MHVRVKQISKQRDRKTKDICRYLSTWMHLLFNQLIRIHNMYSMIMNTSTEGFSGCLWIQVLRSSQDVYEYQYRGVLRMFMNTSTEGFSECLWIPVQRGSQDVQCSWIPVQRDSQDVDEFQYRGILRMLMNTSTEGFSGCLWIWVL